jgi:hypothetical protein
MPRALVTLCILPLCLAATTKPTTRPSMDYGPFLSYSVITPDKKEIVLKGINIRLDERHTICFDTDLMRWAAAWEGGFLDLSKTHQILLKGTDPPTNQGDLLFATRNAQPGVSPNDDLDALTDPRPDHMGPLPREFAHYRGLYLHGNEVILSYTVGDAHVLEHATLINNSIQYEFHVVAGLKTKLDNQFRNMKPRADLPNLTKGGPARYQFLTTKGILGNNDKPYTVDTLTIPENNPWNSWLRPTGLDFFSDGRCAICTLNGDVWIVSGIDEKLQNLTWRRFATGLYEPLGLVIVKDQIYVRGRDQITRLHDLNDDGEADFYENFNNEGAIDSGYHAFCYDLQADSAGNFYYARGGHWYVPGRRDTNALFKLSPDGLKTEIVATGFRAPNGLAVSPDNTLFTSDNQGNWTPSSKINLVRPGAFHGFVADPKYSTKETPIPSAYEPPLCWIPMELDNSSGGQTWIADDRLGPLSNHLVHASYGKSTLFLVLYEHVGERKMPQGGVVPLPFKFDSGIMRARVNPKDGHLYVCGIKGWQTNGARDGCLQRIRFTNKPAYLPIALHIKSGAIEIRFSDLLDRASAIDKDNYSIEQWNYRWTAEYGSKDYSPSNPARVGRDPVEITRADLSPDKMTVTLHFPNLTPVMQMKIAMKLKANDGTDITTAIYNTINVIPKE